MSHIVKELYDPHVHAARARVLEDPGLRALLSPQIDPELFERFLIQYAAHGVAMTAPVEGWIRRAAERSVATGFEEVGRHLLSHAKHEAGHDRMLVDDLRSLTDLWNRRRAPALDAGALLAEPPFDSTRAYADLHETTIAGDLPVGQVAIEYEIEHLSVVFGGPLLENIGRVCGDAVLATQSFIHEHNELDVGHTALNERIMERVLTRAPDAAPRLGAIGSQALTIYARWLSDCLASARAWLSARG